MNEEISERPTGTLFVVATPIGNLSDLTPRAREVLGRVGLIAAEDTRVSRRLLDSAKHRARMVSVNEHSERNAVESLIGELHQGMDIALVSDAGTPLISDPGYRLVAAAHEAGIPVCPVPGPCAAIAALSAAGLPSDRFHFEGFLPARRGPRRRRLEAMAEQAVTMIFYVPARDLGAVLEDLALAFGAERPATLARELSKLHETVLRASLSGLAERVERDPDQLRGEAVVVVGGNPDPVGQVNVGALARELAAELPPSRAAGMLGRLTGMTRSQAWQALERIEASPPS